VVLFFASAGFVHAQGLGGLSQPAGSQGQSLTAVTVQRGAAPYMRQLTAKETTNSGTQSDFVRSNGRLVGLLLWASLHPNL
jgi:hypothetical protein